MHKYLILFNSVLFPLLFASVASVAPVIAAEVEEGKKSEKEIPLLSEVKHPETSAQALTQESQVSPTITAQADAGENKEEIIELDVVGTPLVNFIEERQASPTGVIIIDQKEIQRFNYRTVGEVLRRQPGVVIGGGPGEDKDVRLLGLPKEYTQVLINGERFPDGGENREFKVDRIPVNLVERIEIITNPTATQDSQGVGGTVNIILKKTPSGRVAELTFSGSTQASGGPFGGINLIYGDKVGDFGYFINAGIQQRRAPKDKVKLTTDAQNRLTQDERETESKNTLDTTLAPRFSWQVSPRDTLTFDPLFLRSEEDKDNTRNLTASKFFSPSGRIQELQGQTVIGSENKIIQGWRLGGSWEHQFSSTSDIKLGLAFKRTDEDKDKLETISSTVTTYRNVAGSPLDQARPIRNTTTTKREREDKSDQELLGTVAFNFRPWENHRVTVGLEGSLRDREKKKVTIEQQILPTVLAAVEKTAPKDIYTIEENQFNVFLQDEWRLGKQHTLTAGLRMEAVNNKATAGDNSSVGQSGTVFNPSLHYKYQVTPTTVFRASAARTVRRPKFDDMIPYVDSKDGTLLKPDTVGNPNLIPETSLGVEAGIEQSWGNNTGAFGVNAFYRWVDDKIETSVNFNPSRNRFEQSPRNVGNGKAYGVRLDLQTRTDFIGLPNLTLFGNLSLLGSEVQDKKTGQLRRFNEQPSYVANLGFDYAFPDLGMNIGLTYNIVPSSGKDEIKDDGKREINNQEDTNSLDGYIAFRLADNVQVSLFGKNLLGIERTKSITNFNTAGAFESSRTEKEAGERLYGLSVSWQF
jgi:outer membrane receptor for ferrienterochelin and colicins